MNSRNGEYFSVLGNHGFRHYAHDRDEEAVCKLCWKNALPGGRPFPLIPKAGALSFGRIITGPFARYAPEYFYVADDLTSGKLIGYLSGAEGGAVATDEGAVPWATWRNKIARQIAAEEFGEISPKVWTPSYGFLEGVKFLYTISLGARTLQFLLHLRFSSDSEIPNMPPYPEFHFQVEEGHRGKGIGCRLIEHFLSRFTDEDHGTICVQVTVCEGQRPLAYYKRMTLGGKRLWQVYDRREATIYTRDEKVAWELGPLVENLSLLADRERLLAFVRKERKS